MQLHKGIFTNFGSYPNLELDFNDLGLSLVYGKTGSGKSTIMDAVCWTLFGVTAKGVAADEVKSWQSNGEPTKGELLVAPGTDLITITRIRGKAGQNDLYWQEYDGEPKRGKDIPDTQKLLNKRLSVDLDLYTTAAYFHEFSPTVSFFVDKAKDRRALLEKLAPLEFPTQLAEKVSVARKEAKNEYTKKENDYSRITGQLEQIRSSIEASNRSSELWEKTESQRLNNLENLAENFESDRQRKINILLEKSVKFEARKSERVAAYNATLEDLVSKIKPDSYFQEKLDALIDPDDKPTPVCPTCHQSLGCKEDHSAYYEAKGAIQEEQWANKRLIDQHDSAVESMKRALEEQDGYLGQIKLIKGERNPYTIVPEPKTNPFTKQLKDLRRQLSSRTQDHKTLKSSLEALDYRIGSLSRLYDLSSTLRGELVKKAIRGIESETNRYLETYFDGEIKVEFTADEDNLEVSIQKSGHMCSYKQLSKGQRGLLKLCFSVSVMEAAANKSGVHFDNLFFDESLDGQDEDLKLRSFNLFQELESRHGSIMIIDHALSFQNLFSRKFNVTLSGDFSIIEEESHE